MIFVGFCVDGVLGVFSLQASYTQTRFDRDLKQWIHDQNATNANCKQNGMLVRIISSRRHSTGGQKQRVRVCVNVARAGEH